LIAKYFDVTTDWLLTSVDPVPDKSYSISQNLSHARHINQNNVLAMGSAKVVQKGHAAPDQAPLSLELIKMFQALSPAQQQLILNMVKELYSALPRSTAIRSFS